jgi:acyl carrier protein
MENNVYNRVTAVFRDIFDLPDLEISTSDTAHSIKGWDSLTHVRLIVALEEEFELEFEPEKIMELRSVGELIEAVTEEMSQA